MRIMIVCMLACLFWTTDECVAQDCYSKEYKNALRYGAKVKITVAVSDLDAKPVSNATVNVFFEQKDGNQYKVEGETDSLGMHVVEGMTRSSVGGSVRKEGYYRSVFHLPFATGQERIDSNRWLPWNPTIPVVLKRIRNPVSMILKFAHMQIPQFDEPLGFDLEKHDWVAPDGQGEVPDMLVKFETIDDTSPFRKLVVEFPGEMNGAYVRKKDDHSILKSDYHAMTNGVYEARIENSDGKRGPAHILLGGGDYLVFRVRCKVDDKGRLISAHYGKIYGPFDYFVQSRNKMRLSTMFNPIENDTNLEFDGNGWDDSLFGR